MQRLINIAVSLRRVSDREKSIGEPERGFDGVECLSGEVTHRKRSVEVGLKNELQRTEKCA